MNGYLLIPLFAATASTVLATAILAQDPRGRLNRRTGLLVAGAAWWALCEVLWNTAGDPEAALRLVRLSAPGWVALGPVGLDVLLDLAGRSTPRVRRRLAVLHLASPAFVAAAVATDWMHVRAVPAPWGFAYEPGLAFSLVYYPFTAACLLAGLWAASQALRRSASPTERAQLRWVALGFAVPLVVASTTDVLLPIAGVQVVHLGTISFSFLGASVAWSIHRYGYSLLAPSAFAREVLETIPDGVALLTLEGRVRSANPGLARLLGRAPSELVGAPLDQRLRGVRLAEASEGAVFECEIEPYQGAPFAVSAASRLLRDRQGLPLGRVLVLRDVREVADLRRRLVTAGRLAAVGELAAGIAHEINNPIAFVRANLATLRDYWQDLSKQSPGEPCGADLTRDGEELIAECLEGIERVKLIVHDVKGFAHSGEEHTLVDVNALLDSALRVAGPQIPRGARLERRYADVPLVRASSRHLQQVFLNLLTNAAQAIGAGGSIRLQTARAPGGVEIRVEDDGCGIGPEALERVFDPFFTTKSVGEGTGLGLAISYEIVRSHAGDIRIDSAPGRGTRVDVFFPAEAADEGGDRPGAGAHTGGRSGR